MTRARDVMTAAVSVVKLDTPISEVARRMRDEDLRWMPVADGDKLVGTVTDRDIVTRALAETSDLRQMHAQDVLSPRVLYCLEDEAVADVLLNMREERVRRLPVVDRTYRLVGTVSLGDLAGESAPRAARGDLTDVTSPKPST